jgi:hypothetical protein
MLHCVQIRISLIHFNHSFKAHFQLWRCYQKLAWSLSRAPKLSRPKRVLRRVRPDDSEGEPGELQGYSGLTYTPNFNAVSKASIPAATGDGT